MGNQESSKQYFDKAQQFFSQQRFTEAAEAYLKAFGEYAAPEFLFNVAQCYRLLDDYAQAAFYYRKYLSLSPAAANRAEVEKLITEMERKDRVRRSWYIGLATVGTMALGWATYFSIRAYRRRGALGLAPYTHPNRVRGHFGVEAEKQHLRCMLSPAKEMKKFLGVNRLPAHVVDFGSYMVEMSQKRLDPSHVAKAFIITNASIQRDAMFARTLKESWPDAPYPDDMKVRPEDVMARLLSDTAEGKAYLHAASRGEYAAAPAKKLVKRMSGWGLYDQLARALKAAPALAARANEVDRVIHKGTRKQWMEFVEKNAEGISYAKAGFLGAILGRGDLATADARQVGLWAPRVLGKESVSPQFVSALNARLRQMQVETPAELRPFYEHLVHHAIWDAIGGTQVLHQEIVDCMRS